MSERNDDGAWFAPKRYGYGSGLPIAWQGWALLLGYIVAVTAATWLLFVSIAAYVTIVLLLTFLLILVCARTTRGGWHGAISSRSGSSDDSEIAAKQRLGAVDLMRSDRNPLQRWKGRE